MDIRKVKKLIELLEESGISELEISRARNRCASAPPEDGMQVAATQSVLSCTRRLPRCDAGQSAGERAPRNDEHTVTRPWSAPTTRRCPGREALRRNRSEIKVGQILCIIEP